MNYLVVTVLGMVAAQSLLFSIYLFRQAKGDNKTRLLRIFTLIIGLHFINLLLGRTVTNYPGYGLSWLFISSYGPFIYIYSQLFVRDAQRILYVNLLVPIYPLLLWIFTDKLHHESSADRYFDLWVSLPIYMTFLGYLILSLYTIYRTPVTVKNLNWLKYLVLSFTFLIALHLGTLFFYSSGKGQTGTLLYILEIVFMLFFTAGMVYTALSKPSIFLDIKRLIDLVPKPPKYFYSDLNDDEMNAILSTLESHMSEIKPYLKPELSLESLANDIGINKRHISQVINEKLHKNFNDYVNGYRICEAMELLKESGSDLRIFEVMYEVGFNSKSAFNLSFKRYTGVTPTRYRAAAVKANLPNGLF